MTAVLEAPAAQRTGRSQPTHWCCVTQGAPPLIGLCGELSRTQRRTHARVDCPECLERVADHVGSCRPCHPWAQRYR